MSTVFNGVKILQNNGLQIGNSTATTINRTIGVDNVLNLPGVTINDTLVSRTSIDTLTNKTIQGGVNGNNITSNNLATTGAPVNVLSAPPLAGQVLVATNPTTAIWQDNVAVALATSTPGSPIFVNSTTPQPGQILVATGPTTAVWQDANGGIAGKVCLSTTGTTTDDTPTLIQTVPILSGSYTILVETSVVGRSESSGSGISVKVTASYLVSAGSLNLISLPTSLVFASSGFVAPGDSVNTGPVRLSTDGLDLEINVVGIEEETIVWRSVTCVTYSPEIGPV